ncbi:MAG: polyprenyl synthetase family protein [Candidatus Saccharimonadales bacterium]
MKIVNAISTDTVEDFKVRLQEYKDLIDTDIVDYSKGIQKSTLQQFGANSRLEIDAFLSILSRGGKRIRGALTLLGYEMSGGTNRQMIIEAARAVEMLHAYILIIDDIQDRSIVRRGGPTANVILANFHRKHRLSGDADHFGLSVALNAALSGAHAAQMILANLNANEEVRLKALSIMNRTMLITAHGQTGDIMNEVVAEVSSADIDQVLEWKTAHYTILNPLHMGMVLAGADCHATDAITDYAMHTGRAFQLSDDLLGLFGTEFDSGKSPMDDIREGKRTLLMQHALDNSTNGNKNFLIQMLGNENISQTEFMRCKDIIVEAGSVEFARSQIDYYVRQALISLDKEAHRWSDEGVLFMRDLARYMSSRTS